MIAGIRVWLVTSALAGLAVLRAAAAEPETPLPAAESEALPPPNVDPGRQQPAYVLPPPSWPIFDFHKPDPLLDRPNVAQPGWYTDVETNILFAHLRNQLGGPVPNALTGKMDFVS